MKASELKREYERVEGGYFFNRATMKYWGDTMRNYKVCSGRVSGKEVWILLRKKPVRYGNQAPHYFAKGTLEEVFVELAGQQA